MKRPSETALIFLLAVAASAMFSLLVFPRVSDPLGSELGTDGYDRLGRSLSTRGTFSFFPDIQPTVLRGPGYPALIAVALVMCEPCYPYSVQLLQAILHGCTCLIVFYMGLLLFDRRKAILAAVACTVYPSLLWYTARIVTETFSVFIFTAAVFSFLSLQQKPSGVRATILGVTLGVCALVRQVFLPLTCATPLLLFFVSRPHDKRIKHAITVFVVASLVILPWTIRNYVVADRFIVVHALSGYNAQVGDYVADHFWDSPFGYLKLVFASEVSQRDTGSYIWFREADARRGAIVDQQLLAHSLQRCIDDPFFFMRKVALNAILFWSYGSTPTTTLVTIIFQIPLVLAFFIATFRCVKNDGLLSRSTSPVWLILVYYLGHLPFFAIARYGRCSSRQCYSMPVSY